MELTSKQRRYLRSLAHRLNPVVLMGKQGLTEKLIQDLDRNLSHHELIKMKISGEDRNDLKAVVESLTKATKAVEVQVIGHVAVLYRPAKEPEIKLPR